MNVNCRQYLCLLDGIGLTDRVNLGDYEVRFFSPQDLIGLLHTSQDDQPSSVELARYELYAQFPWGVLERPARPEPETEIGRILSTIDISWNHAGRRLAWWPFAQMLRNLHLMKPSLGPIIPRHFYFRSEQYDGAVAQIDRKIYAEPEMRSAGPDGPEYPRLTEYSLAIGDVEAYVAIDKQFEDWESQQPEDEKAPLQTALAYFENADQQLDPVCLDPFQAIEPLMSYEAAIEALLIGEEENGVERKLIVRIKNLIDDDRPALEGFIERVFWLRSKVAHGVRSPNEISRLIVQSPDAEIIDTPRNKRIPSGPYSEFYLGACEFPPFLVNLRECTRRVIKCYLDGASRGETKEQIIRRIS